MRVAPIISRGAIGWLAVIAGACLERGSSDPPREPPSPVSVVRDAAAAGRASLVKPRPDPSGVPDPSATLYVRLEAEPSHLDPMIAGDGVAIRVALGDIYEGLLCRDRPVERPRPCLASAVDVDAGATEWRFTIRRGVRFHDGAELTTEDVTRSIEAVARAEIATPLTAELDDLISASAQGDTVIVKFAERRLDRTGTFARLPIARAAHLGAKYGLEASHPRSRAPVGTGPLRFARWIAGESIELVRFDDYWGLPSRAAVIHYRIVSSRERAYAMAKNHRLDLAVQLPIGEALEVAALSPSLEVFTYAQPAYLAAVYNARRQPMASAEKRRALTMLLDRQAVIRAILADRAAPITGPYLGEEADPSIAPLPFDLAEARGAFPERVRLEILYPIESRTMARIADIWAADARGVIELVPAPRPFAAVLARARAGDFDVVLLAFTSGLELDMYSRLHSSQIGGENYGAIADPILDARLEAVRAAADPAQLIAATRAAHRRINEIAPYAFIASDVRAGLVADDIGGLGEGDGLAARTLWRARDPR